MFRGRDRTPTACPQARYLAGLDDLDVRLAGAPDQAKTLVDDWLVDPAPCQLVAMTRARIVSRRQLGEIRRGPRQRGSERLGSREVAGGDDAQAFLHGDEERGLVGEHGDLVLHELEGHDITEIAQLLGIAVVTVRWHLAAARRALRATILKQGGAS